MVNYPDGRIEPYNAKDVSERIYAAIEGLGGNDRLIADELAGVVTEYIQKGIFGISQKPEIDFSEVEDAVVKVLIETGHARTAKHYILSSAKSGVKR